ncbi:dolichol-phosphate mannosyltransferase [Streptoalloteichus tenebrarius]|uniref:Dolichol-phosphate mannosyltransferase n=1 Tax=Streptoalloteichus tenebrarius (strain ATCC 17920 / DSM 40477 / JCM 4838 / CBS 697.72 / NBRC 16177 / NCIMB 11028 / NRRL B-12390 / A12253. 1 / ISP 5477) TaxID=1933 RepID=A0ABT1I3D1_STRSD|nr:glycosyltransferase family 2 protein [Streptoalloteichus tenebrarius]MCP2262302.1 dolichol-phosphate mannosyltransferase [Streptoalloteichus tenebrarius]BFF01806.1 glycosyltransferase family 2 protein [Streptoalloteichus tenebrarius]
MSLAGTETNGTAPARRKLVSIVVPAFNEAGNAAGLVDFYRQIRAAYQEFDFELVLVDDGSTDGTADLVVGALRPEDQARVCSFSRNFGSHEALTAGFRLCRGDCALTISADLQESLETVGRFLDEWRAGNEVVWGIRRTRAVPKGVGNMFSQLFSQLFHRLSEIPTYPKEGPSQILLDRIVLDALNRMEERNRNIFGIIAWIGFRQSRVEFEQLPRPSGKSKWTNKKKLKLVVDSFVGFAYSPLRIPAWVGTGVAVVGVLSTLSTLVAALVTWSTPVGWALVASLVTTFGGLNLMVLGIMGEYLWRAGDDARRRPTYVVRSVREISPSGSSSDERHAVEASRS